MTDNKINEDINVQDILNSDLWGGTDLFRAWVIETGPGKVQEAGVVYEDMRFGAGTKKRKLTDYLYYRLWLLGAYSRESPHDKLIGISGWFWKHLTKERKEQQSLAFVTGVTDKEGNRDMPIYRSFVNHALFEINTVPIILGYL